MKQDGSLLERIETEKKTLRWFKKMGNEMNETIWKIRINLLKSVTILYGKSASLRRNQGRMKHDSEV